MKKRRKALILDGNSSQCLPFIKSLSQNYDVHVSSKTLFCAGFFSRYTHTRLYWKKSYLLEIDLIEQIIDTVSKSNYCFILPCSDRSSRLLSQYKNKLAEYTQVIVPNYDIFMWAADKNKTMLFCTEHDIPCPKTYDLSFDTLKTINKINFPVIIKPKIGVGAVGFRIFVNELELRDFIQVTNDLDKHLLQEYIPNEKQYTVEAFCDHNNVLRSCVVSEKLRFFPLIGGTSTCNITVRNPQITEIVKKLLESLGWHGFANIDLIFDPRDGIPKVIEINPRIGATVKLAFISGVDFSCFIDNWNMPFCKDTVDNYCEGIILRNFLLECVWFLFAGRRTIISKQRFFSFFSKNTHYQFIDWDDPFPIIGSFLGYFGKYLSLSRIRNKLGR